MPSTNKVGFVALLLAVLGLGFGLGRLTRPAADASASLTDVDALTELSELRSERARMQEQLSSLRASHQLAEAPPERDLASPPSSAGGRRFGRSREPRTPELSPANRLIMARQQYGQLFRELDLSDAEADALLAVLSEREHGRPPGLRGRARAATTPEDQEQTRAEREEIAKLLGPERAAEFERLRGSLPIRRELSLTRGQLERVGEPMSDEQQTKLLEKLSAREVQEFPRGVEGSSPEERAEQFQAWRRERSKALRESAEGVLTPRQIQRLDEADAVMDATRARPGGMNAGSAGSGAANGR